MDAKKLTRRGFFKQFLAVAAAIGIPIAEAEAIEEHVEPEVSAEDEDYLLLGYNMSLGDIAKIEVPDPDYYRRYIAVGMVRGPGTVVRIEGARSDS